MKVLKREHKGKESVYQDFFSEEQVLSKLCGTKHIVEILGAGLTEDDRPFVVLEMLKEQTLAGRYLKEDSWKKVRNGVSFEYGGVLLGRVGERT